MPRTRRIGVQTYRYHRLEILDDGGFGWMVAIYPGAGTADAPPRGRGVTLRNNVPNGLPTLIEEARLRIDRALDGPVWLEAP
jgi:hypothetical protein